MCICGGYMRRQDAHHGQGQDRLTISWRQCVECERTGWERLYGVDGGLLDTGSPARRWFNEASGGVLPRPPRVSATAHLIPQQPLKRAPERRFSVLEYFIFPVLWGVLALALVELQFVS